jgi:hypothetical protein
MIPDEPSKQLLNACYGENSLKISEQVVSYFPKRVYNGLEDLAETIMNPAIAILQEYQGQCKITGTLLHPSLYTCIPILSYLIWSGIHSESFNNFAFSIVHWILYV